MDHMRGSKRSRPAAALVTWLTDDAKLGQTHNASNSAGVSNLTIVLWLGVAASKTNATVLS